MSLLAGKVAIITGATRGIGRSIATEFAKHGATIVFTYRSSVDKAKSLEEELTAMGTACKGIQADAADMEAAKMVVQTTLDLFKRVDVVVNNAGITKDNLLLRMTEDQWNDVIRTNLNSVFFMSKAALRPMLRQRSGSFVNISSVVGLEGNPGQANYAASKAGILGFTKSLAKELAKRSIRANVVAPGFIETEMTKQMPEAAIKKWLADIPMSRTGKPHEVANLCVFLASDMSQYITGQVINVDGGMLM